MNFVDAVKHCFQNYVTFSGRASRSEYWFFFLFNVIANIVLSLLDRALFLSVDPATQMSTGTAVLSTVYALGSLLPSLAVAGRRLHDLDKSALFLLVYIPTALLMIIPLIGLIVALVVMITFIVFFVQKGTTGDNRFGPDPLAGQVVTSA